MKLNAKITLPLFASLIVLSIIAIQVYWIYKNYQDDKEKIITNLTTSIENATDKFFLNKATEAIRELSKKMDQNQFAGGSFIDGVKKEQRLTGIGEIVTSNISKITINGSSETITSSKKKPKKATLEKVEIHPVAIPFNTKEKKSGKKGFVTIEIDSDETHLKQTVKLFDESYDSKKLFEIMKRVIDSNKLGFNYQIVLERKKKRLKAFDSKTKSFNLQTFTPYSNSIVIKSGFGLPNEKLRIHYDTLFRDSFFRNRFIIVFSLFSTLSIITCLIYLLQTIAKQKRINEMKNDFISNVTHELKTPIAVVSSAIEGIEKFNQENDKEKTKRYLQISNQQLFKLNDIVEKILETASLESKELQLKKELVSITEIIERTIEHTVFPSDKEVKTNLIQDVFSEVDVFHFENMINNLLENAIKYGGNTITVFLEQQDRFFEIRVHDNGEGIKKEFQSQLFEKFYRVPTHNVHNVKGFGVGLYYVKQIIEKHSGTITLQSSKNNTLFIIRIPYGKN